MLINRNDVRVLDYSRIKKYHISNNNFNVDEIRKIKDMIYKKYTYIQITKHFNDEINNDKNSIVLDSIDCIFKYGKCFEYKIVDDKYLYRLAIRVYGDVFDTIYIIQPIYYSEGIFLRLITCYTNNKDDNHITLNKKRYA